MIKNIIFDIGNVLVYFRWRELMEDLGFDEMSIGRLEKNMIMHPLWSELDRASMTEEEVIESFKRNNEGLEEKIVLFLEHKGEIVEPYPYVEEWMKELKAKGYNLYYLTNYPKSFFECHSEVQFKFLPFMSGGVVSANVHLIKPDHGIYKHLLDSYHLKAEESIFIDDAEKNIIAARELGIHGIVFENYEQASKSLNEIIMSLEHQ